MLSASLAMAAAPDTLDLGGTWRCALDDQDAGIAEAWQNRTLAKSVTLPGSLDEAGLGTVNTNRETTMLTRKVTYTGAAWYQRDIEIPADWSGKRIELVLERCHWGTTCYIDGTQIGSKDSLAAPHIYDLTGRAAPGKRRITIRVDNRLLHNIGEYSHMVTDHTQTQWNGIIGRMQLRALPAVSIDSVQAYPDLAKKQVRLEIVFASILPESVDASLSIGLGIDSTPVAMTKQVKIQGTRSTESIVIPIPEPLCLWSEYSPVLYQAELILASPTGANRHTVTFGMRELSTDSTHLLLNGRRVSLRGNVNCCEFPRTGYPSMDLRDWMRIMSSYRAHGLNHVRCHSWVPPEAAFEAADRVGIMLQVETELMWRWMSDPDTREYSRLEGLRILECFGNHPSFCLLGIGNECNGGDQASNSVYNAEILRAWKAKDRRRLYTGNVAFTDNEENDFDVNILTPKGWLRIRDGLFLGEDTTNDYTDEIAVLRRPMLAHEAGQYCAFPNLDEMKKYTGVLEPRNFEAVRERMAAQGLLPLARDFLRASGMLQVEAYKENIEGFLRSTNSAGFQLLQLEDFPGQGTSLVGVLDAFHESKGYVTADEFRRFCGETVPLLCMSRHSWYADETFAADVKMYHYGEKPLAAAGIAWSFADAAGQVVASGTLAPRDIPIGSGIPCGKLAVRLASFAAPAEYTVTLAVPGTPYTNRWRIWVYPREVAVTGPRYESIKIAHSFAEAKQALLDGRKTLFIADRTVRSVQNTFAPVYWNCVMFKNQANKLGILADPDHPAFRHFPTRTHTDWQWFPILNDSAALDYSGVVGLEPIIRVIDDWNTCRPLAILFEAACGKGNLVVSSIDLEKLATESPAGRQLLHSLLDYMAGPAFAPKTKLGLDKIASLCAARPLFNAKVKASSNAKHRLPRNAFDGDPQTFWQTDQGGKRPKDFPHFIMATMPRPITLRGIRYLPRQDQSAGMITSYEVYVFDNPRKPGAPCAKGTLAADNTAKEIVFDKPVTGSILKLVALAGKAKQKGVAAAEIEILPANPEK